MSSAANSNDVDDYFTRRFIDLEQSFHKLEERIDADMKVLSLKCEETLAQRWASLREEIETLEKRTVSLSCRIDDMSVIHEEEKSGLTKNAVALLEYSKSLEKELKELKDAEAVPPPEEPLPQDEGSINQGRVYISRNGSININRP